jgi:hypothetical protein
VRGVVKALGLPIDTSGSSDLDRIGSENLSSAPGAFQQQAYHNYPTIKDETDRMRQGPG